MIIIFFINQIVSPNSYIFKYENQVAVKDYFKKKLSPNNFSYFQVLFDNRRSTNKLNNDYNIKFLPNTEVLNLKFNKIDLSNYLSSKKIEVGYAKGYKKNVKASFYLESYQKNLLLLSKNGKLFYNDYNNIIDKKKLLETKTNLEFNSVLDMFIHANELFISGVLKIKECTYLKVVKGKIINLERIDFTEIFLSKECSNSIQAGRMQKLNNSDSLLISTAADILKNKVSNDPKPQDDNSIFGKTILINLKNNQFKIFSKGHRNILGLYSDGNIILATENGPGGGDEINKIQYNKNYGWPIASYGQKYSFKLNNKQLDYKPSHIDFGFVEPIFSFLPSIGISEIIKIDNNFSNKWDNNFLIASLNGHHIYRVKFDRNYEKVIYMEKILIGERIRDMIYLKKEKTIIMALENTGSIGLLSISSKY